MSILTIKIILSVVASIAIWCWDKIPEKKRERAREQRKRDSKELEAWWNEVQSIGLVQGGILRYPKHLMSKGWIQWIWRDGNAYLTTPYGEIPIIKKEQIAK